MGFLGKVGHFVGDVVGKVANAVASTPPLELLLGTHGFVANTALVGLAAGTALSPVAIASGLFLLSSRVKDAVEEAKKIEAQIDAESAKAHAVAQQVLGEVARIRGEIGAIADGVSDIARSAEEIARSVASVATAVGEVAEEVHALRHQVDESTQRIERSIAGAKHEILDAIRDQSYLDAKSKAHAALANAAALARAPSISKEHLAGRLWGVQQELNENITVMLDCRAFDTTTFVDVAPLFLGWSTVYDGLADAGEVGPRSQHPLVARLREMIDAYLRPMDELRDELQHRFAVLPVPRQCFDVIAGTTASLPYKEAYALTDRDLRATVSPRARKILEAVASAVSASEAVRSLASSLGGPSHGGHATRPLSPFARHDLDEPAVAAALAAIPESDRAILDDELELLMKRLRVYRVDGSSLVAMRLQRLEAAGTSLAWTSSSWTSLAWVQASAQPLAEVGVTEDVVKQAIDLVKMAGTTGGMRGLLVATLAP